MNKNTFKKLIQLTKDMENKNEILSTALSKLCDWYPIPLFGETQYFLTQLRFESEYDNWKFIRDIISRWLREDVDKIIYKNNGKEIEKNVTDVDDLYDYLEKDLIKKTA